MAGAGNWHNTTWVIENNDSRLEVASRGAAPVSWKIRQPNGKWRELLDGYANDAELEAIDACRSVIMAPWSNRLNNGRYVFKGTTYQFTPDQHADPQANHGLALDKAFTLIHPGRDESMTLEVCVGEIPAYPWPIRVRVVYTLGGTVDEGLWMKVQVTAKNMATGPAPVGLGWHPYFKLGEVDQTSLEISAKTVVNPGADLIPLPGDAAYSAVKEYPVAYRPLQGHHIDLAFTELDSTDGYAWMRLSDDTGASIEMRYLDAVSDQRGQGILHLFTGDTLPTRTRNSVSLLPCTFMTDAFNREECAEAVVLQPGCKRELTAQVCYRHGK